MLAGGRVKASLPCLRDPLSGANEALTTLRPIESPTFSVPYFGQMFCGRHSKIWQWPSLDVCPRPTTI
jgi:hypothetical protein